MPNFIKIALTVAEISRFSSFKNGGHLPSWIFLNSQILMTGAVKTHFAPACHISQRSLEPLRIAIFQVWQPSTILDLFDCYYYYAAFNVPRVGRKDDELQGAYWDHPQ